MEDIKINGLSADEWEALANPEQPSDEDLKSLGIIQDTPQEPSQNTPQKVERQDYEQLGYWDTVKDEAKAATVELSHFLVPKKYELKYTPRTKAGEAFQTFSKYIFGIDGLLIGGEAAGAIKTAALANEATGIAKVAGGVESILKGNKFFKTGKGGLKALGVKGLNILTQGVLQGAIIDSTIHDVDEGRLADMFGETNNKFIDWLQTDENDSTAEAKLKNVIDGALFSVGINGVISGVEPILGRFFKNVKTLKNQKVTGQEAENIAEEIAQDKQKLEKITFTADLFNNVDSILEEAQKTGADPYQLMIDRFHPKDIEEGTKAINLRLSGEQPFIHSDGTWDIAITKYEDAYKVTPEQYQKQLTAMDDSGNLAISHMNSAVKDTWEQRGLISGEGLTSAKATERNDTTKMIIDYYKDKWDLGKNKITVKYGDFKSIPDGKATQYKNGNVLIQINSNSQDIYTTLRSELEHARDMIKGEVPNQAEKHFARYNGMNEAEMASGYVHKKAAGKAQIKATETAINNIKNNIEQYKSEGFKFEKAEPIEGAGEQRYNLINKEGQNLGYVEYTVDGNNLDIDEVRNTTKSIKDWKTGQKLPKGENDLPSTPNVAEKLIDNLISEHPDKEIHWDAVTEDGIKFKEKYLSKHPELRNRVEGLSTAEEVDNLMKNEYNTPKGGIDATGNISEYGSRDVQGIREETSTNDRSSSVNNSKEQPIPKQDGNLVQSNSRVDSGRTATDSNISPTQLKLDFNTAVSEAKTTEGLVDDITTGAAKANTAEDIDTIINKIIELEPDISGTTWEAIAKDADKLADVMEQAAELGLYDDLTKALSMKDVETMDAITRKVLAAERLSTKLGDKLTALGENPPIEAMKPIIDMIDIIGRYINETGSASGRSLQARGLINNVLVSFGSLRLSPLTKEGIKTISDVLSEEIGKLMELNFTRGGNLTPEQMKQTLIESILKNDKSPLSSLLVTDKEIANKFNSILDEFFKTGNVTPEAVYSKLEDAIIESRYNEVYKAARLAEDNKSMFKTIRNWCDEQGGFSSFYVHNLLSGVGTLMKNVISGGLNTLYFPAKKIVAGLLGGGDSMVKEGWNTYKNLMSSWREAWSLGKQAFFKGDGQLSMMKDTMALADDETFRGFREWKFDYSTPEGQWQALQNYHSMMTRAMGASDEFMSQLNYRAIKRAKALEQAEAAAKKFGITDEKAKNAIADNIFNQAFDEAGRPKDVETLAEAKDILYQLPLNGEIFDRTTGEMNQVRNQSWVTQFAGAVNNLAAKNGLMKIMFPFVKTGANILQQNLEHNGIYAVLSPSQRQLLMSNTREGALARAQVAFGMFSFMTAAGLAMSGAITGSAPADKKERAALFETGWKPYSIRLGDKYISYQGYEPIQTICGFAADSVNIYGNITNSEDEKKWEKFSQQIMSTAINNFIDKAAFRTGLRQLAFITSPDDNVNEFLKSLAQTAQGFLPDSSMVKSVSSFGSRDITAPKSAYERIFNNYFNRGLGDYRRDVFGNRQDNFGLLVTNINPDNANLPEYEEMEYLSQFGFSPSDISKEIKETSLKYVDFKDPNTGRSVYDTMQEELSTIRIDGKTLQESVRELVTSQEYKDLVLGVNMNGVKYSASDPTKLNAIRAIFVEYNNAALQNVIKEYGDLYIDKKGRTMDEAIEEANLEKLNQSINQGLEHNIGNQIKRFGQ